MKAPEYEGEPATFLVLGSDRRAKAKNAFERGEPHSDTILLVRFDPSQGQTSVLSIPRDLMVNIRTPEGAYYPSEKINAAYTLGSRLKGVDGGSRAGRRNDRARSLPGPEAERDHRRQLQRLHRSRRHARLRLRERRPPLPRRRRDRRKLLGDQPPAGLPEALLRKRALLRALPPLRLGLRPRRAPAGLHARPARAGQPGNLGDRQGREGRRPRDPLDVQPTPTTS